MRCGWVYRYLVLDLIPASVCFRQICYHLCDFLQVATPSDIDHSVLCDSSLVKQVLHERHPVDLETKSNHQQENKTNNMRQTLSIACMEHKTMTATHEYFKFLSEFCFSSPTNAFEFYDRTNEAMLEKSHEVTAAKAMLCPCYSPCSQFGCSMLPDFYDQFWSRNTGNYL